MADKKAKSEKTEDEAELKAEGTPPGEGGEAVEDSGGGRFAGKKKILIIAGGVVLLLLLGGAGAYFAGALDGLLGKGKPDCEKVKEGEPDYEACLKLKEETEAAAGPGVFITVPDLVVNLSSPGSKQPHFLKISLKIELEKEDEAKFNEMLPRIVDQFQTFLRELRMEDLRGSSGIYRMKIELLARVRAVAPGVKVRDVLFQEILVQ